MKSLTTLFLSLSVISLTWAQGTITGSLQDADTKEALIGATALIKGTSLGAVADFNGNFEINNVPAGSQTLLVRYVGYADFEQDVTVKNGETTDVGALSVTSNAIGLKEVEIIASVAIDRKTPVAVSTIKAEEIEDKLGNREFPEILNQTPSIYATKTSGGFGDSRINVRGFTQENVALLINGIPVNSMEDNRVFWSNWAGLGDVTRTIQVQRGLGASRLAVSSVGGTINIVTKTTDQRKGGSFTTSTGNDGYKKNMLTLSTGRLDNGWAFTFSGSRTTGDGYIEGNYIDAYSYFGSIAKEIGENQLLQLTGVGAPQRHGQRSFAHPIDDSRDKYGTRWNDDFGSFQGRPFHFRENFYHKPQVNLNYYNNLSDNTLWSSSAYFSVGRGGGTGDLGGFIREDGAYRGNEFRQAKDQYGHQQFDEYYLYNTGQANALYDTALAPLTFAMNGDTSSGQIAAARNFGAGVGNGMIKRASMNEHQWFGLLSTVNTQLSDNINVTGGVDLRWYTGSHYRKTINLLGADYWFDDDNVNNTSDWVDFNGDGMATDEEMGNLISPTNDAERLWGNVDTDERIDYYNDEDINWYGAFVQFEYTKDNLSTFLSGAVNYTQMRRIDFFDKLDSDNNQTTDWSNFTGGNIKIGANYNIDEHHNVFINGGFIARAPLLDALYPTFSNDELNEEAVNENVVALELGYGARGRNINFNLNGYFTQWTDKTEVNDSFEDDDGNQLFLNVVGVDALHTGVELDFNWRANQDILINGFGSLGSWEWSNNVEGIVSDQSNEPIDTVNLFIDGLKVGDAAQTTFGVGAKYQLGAGLAIDARYTFYDNLYASFSPSDRDDEDLVIGGKPVQALKLPNYGLMAAGLTWKFDFAGLDSKLRFNVNNLLNEEYISEAFDRPSEDLPNGEEDDDPDVYQKQLDDTSGWFGFGRTWNLAMSVRF